MRASLVMSRLTLRAHSRAAPAPAGFPPLAQSEAAEAVSPVEVLVRAGDEVRWHVPVRWYAPAHVDPKGCASSETTL